MKINKLAFLLAALFSVQVVSAVTLQLNNTVNVVGSRDSIIKQEDRENTLRATKSFRIDNAEEKTFQILVPFTGDEGCVYIPNCYYVFDIRLIGSSDANASFVVDLDSLIEFNETEYSVDLGDGAYLAVTREDEPLIRK
jgi:hypothetical protein